MATEVKNYVVALKARIGKFRQKMKGVSKSFNRVGRMAKKAALVVAKFAAGLALAAVAAVAGVAIMVKRFANGMDATGKLSDRLGIATEKLIGLRHAAELGGVSAQALEKGLEGYNRRLGEAVQGMGSAKPALEALGLSAGKLAGLPLQEQMYQIADAIKQLATPAERAAAANALFGKSGMAMVNMLQQGGAAMKASMAEADALGLTYGRDQAAIAERFNDTLTRIKGAITGVAQTIVSGLLPHFEKVAAVVFEFAQKWLPSLQKAFGVVFDAIVEALGICWQAISVYFDVIKSVLESFGVDFSGTGDLVKRILDWMVEAYRWWVGVVIKAITFVEAVFVNWREALTIVFKGAYLGMVQFYQGIKHFLIDSLPKILTWVSENWRLIFTDVFNFTSTIFDNMTKNVTGFFKSTWEWLKGNDADYTWTGLTEGFETTLTSLPEIADRVKTELEKSLELDIGKAKTKIATYYDSKVADRLAKLKKENAAVKTVGDQAAKTAVKVAKAVEKAVAPVIKPAAKIAGTAAAASGPKGAASFGILGAGVSIAAMAGRFGEGKTDVHIARDTQRSADSLDKLEKAATRRGVLVFVK